MKDFFDPVVPEFTYNRFADLFYYLLAHMPLDNAADEYDPDYIRKMAEILGTSPAIPDKLVEYYQQHFDRLMIISFFPLTTGSIDECRNALASCGMLTEEDMDTFVLPMMEICRQAAVSYYPWWDRHHTEVLPAAEKVYIRFRELTSRFGSFFSGLETRIRVIFSYSLRKCGRAFMNPDVQTVFLQYPENDQDILPCFLQFLHECTHRVTDPLITQPILMADGSHNLSEYQVLCFDEYLIQKLCPDLSDAYRGWVEAELLDQSHDKLGEAGEQRISACLKRFVNQ